MNAANLHGTWRLTRLGEQELPHDARLTLQFEPGGRMGGFAGVNRYFGTYRADDVGGLRFGDIGATRRAGPPQDMQRERQILGALSTVTSYILEDDTLRLTDGHDTLLVGERTR